MTDAALSTTTAVTAAVAAVPLPGDPAGTDPTGMLCAVWEVTASQPSHRRRPRSRRR
ncbi:hypothetical protein [Frankia gtarii]|uniref:hypothetical protein n=1 Tax=Frankia gtarii TaxID=2950102 RepID=UPI0021C135D7|nr:hypothetical protein [Frankia gtarii]